MATERVQYILDLDVANESDLSRSVLLALISCLTVQEAAELLEAVVFQPGIRRRYALRRVAEDMYVEVTPEHEGLLATLATELSRSNVRGESIGYAASTLLESAPKERRAELIHSMLHHRRKDLRNRAYKALTDKWDDAFTSDLWRNVEQHGDRHAAALLAQHETEERVWRDFDLLKATGGAWVARLILSRVLEAGMQVNLDAVEDDPITRTYLAAKFHLPIDLRRVEQSMDHLLEDDRAGLLIWSLGKLKAWDLVLLADKLWPGAQDRALRRWITPLEETT